MYMIEEEKLYVDVHRRRLSFIIIIIYISIVYLFIYLFVCLMNILLILVFEIQERKKNACIYDYILIFFFYSIFVPAAATSNSTNTNTITIISAIMMISERASITTNVTDTILNSRRGLNLSIAVHCIAFGIWFGFVSLDYCKICMNYQLK